MAKVEETERTYDEDRVPQGDNYVAFFAGFVPRDRDTMRPQFYEGDKWEHGQRTDEKETRVVWLFEVIYPAEFKGSEISGSAPWKGFKVTKNAKGEAILQVERVGQMLVNMIKWAETCGMEWGGDLADKLPDAGPITDQMILEAVEQALLDHAREGTLVVIKTNDKGRIDTGNRNDTCLMPLPAGPQAKKVEGIDYTVPDFYGATAGLPPGAAVAGSWDEGYLDALRAFIRDDLRQRLITGENVLTLDEAKEKRLLGQAAQTGGQDYATRAQVFAQGMAEGGYDAIDGALLKRLVGLVTGLSFKGLSGAIVDALAPPQLESAVSCLSAIVEALGKEVPAIPVPPEPPDIDDDMPF